MHNGDVARGGKALQLFGVTARLASFANEISRRIKPGPSRVRRRRRASHVDDIARWGRWRMVTADGI